ncbi:hypothetical protein ScPMuIL_011471 [Solemya velum]
MIIAILCSIFVALLGCTAASPRYQMLQQSSLIQDQIEASMDTVIHTSIGPHTPISCSSLCLVEPSCRSFFHVNLTGYCQIHKKVLSVLTDPTSLNGSRYYIIDGQTDVDCGNPPEAACYNLTTSGTKAGDTATYTCLRLSSTTSKQTCADDGQWSGDLPRCDFVNFTLERCFSEIWIRLPSPCIGYILQISSIREFFRELAVSKKLHFKASCYEKRAYITHTTHIAPYRSESGRRLPIVNLYRDIGIDEI